MILIDESDLCFCFVSDPLRLCRGSLLPSATEALPERLFISLGEYSSRCSTVPSLIPLKNFSSLPRALAAALAPALTPAPIPNVVQVVGSITMSLAKLPIPLTQGFIVSPVSSSHSLASSHEVVLSTPDRPDQNDSKTLVSSSVSRMSLPTLATAYSGREMMSSAREKKLGPVSAAGATQSPRSTSRLS